jgi:hypothetical protein
LKPYSKPNGALTYSNNGYQALAYISPWNAFAIMDLFLKVVFKVLPYNRFYYNASGGIVGNWKS